MPSVCVFGAQWGDEGKGKIIDRMAADADLVVRFQGGANAGHTVVVEGEKYVVHLIPSGILHPGKVNVIGCGVAVDPLKLLQEIDGLRERGVHVDGDNLRLSARAHVIFEHHRRIDGAAERWRGVGRIGTTGRGIGPCYADKAARTGLRVSDLLEPERCRERLTAALAEKNAHLRDVHGEEPIELEAQLEIYTVLGDRLRPFVGNTGAEVRAAYDAGKAVLFEGAQGLMLDIDLGTYPFVTSSNTGAGAVASPRTSSTRSSASPRPTARASARARSPPRTRPSSASACGSPATSSARPPGARGGAAGWTWWRCATPSSSTGRPAGS